jgi:hypothetical protein
MLEVAVVVLVTVALQEPVVLVVGEMVELVLRLVTARMELTLPVAGVAEVRVSPVYTTVLVHLEVPVS